MRGFLGTEAPFNADLNLLVQLAMGGALLAGAWLARRKRFAAHGICQATVMLLNLVMIALVMAPAFHAIVPQLPAGLGKRFYAVATAHAALGVVAELLGIYIVLVAGTRLVPQRLRFQRWKPWMRAELVLWWVVILMGFGTYYVWYTAPQGRGAQRTAPSSAAHVVIQVSNLDFTPKEVSVAPGTTVEWIDNGGRHTIEADDGSFKSTPLLAGARFEHKFDQPGIVPYHCGFHGAAGGKDMAGVVRVSPR